MAYGQKSREELPCDSHASFSSCPRCSPHRPPWRKWSPNWTGINDIAIEKAKRIAGKDYVILLTDMYGEGTRPTNAAQAKAAVEPLYSDRNLMRARIRKAFQQLQAEARRTPIDLHRLAAIGFCFGGADDTSTMPSVPAFTAEMHQGRGTVVPDDAELATGKLWRRGSVNRSCGGTTQPPRARYSGPSRSSERARPHAGARLLPERPPPWFVRAHRPEQHFPPQPC